MKSVIAGVSMLMLGAALAVGCGGPQEPQSESQPAASAGAPDQTTASTPQEQLPDWVQPQNGKVGAQSACCYVKCSKWHGPFPGVDYNNCTNFGRYWCPQQGGGAFSDAKWDNC